MRRLPFLCFLAVLLLSAAACGGGEDERASGIVHRAVVAALASDIGAIDRFPGELPEDMPAEPPLYAEADLIGSSRVLGPAPTGSQSDGAGGEAGARAVLYFIVLDTNDERERVFDFYGEALEEKPWQVDASVSIRAMDRLEFSKADDADISGIVQIVPDEEDERTSIFISLQDAGALVEAEPTFEPGESLPLPRGFPSELPEYQGAIVTSTAFQRGPESENLLLIFLTTDGRADVIAFYREAFDELGWTVQERPGSGSEARLDFQGRAEAVQGRLVVSRFAEDAQYTEVDLQLQVRSAQEPADGSPTATPASR